MIIIICYKFLSRRVRQRTTGPQPPSASATNSTRYKGNSTVYRVYKRADQKALAYTQKKRLKKEHDRELEMLEKLNDCVYVFNNMFMQLFKTYVLFLNK